MIVFPTNEYEAKHILFRPTCGGCGAKIRRSPYENIGFLCKDCKPRTHMTDQSSSCDMCTFELDCVMRVSSGIWTRCETPDTSDIARIIQMEGIDDQKTRSAVESALSEGGDRSILEAYVSKVAAQVYQSRLARRQRKVS